MIRFTPAALLLLPALAFGQAPGLPDTLSFIPNAGQWEGGSLFVARHRGALVVLARDRLELHLDPGLAPAVSLEVEGGSPDTQVQGLEPGSGKFNFLLGNDPSRWRTGLQGFPKVLHRGIRPGIDLLWREQDGNLEYDLFVEPGIDIAGFVVRTVGVQELHLGPGGELSMHTATGIIRQTAPVAWEETEHGARRPLACRFRLIDGLRYGFAVEDRNPEAKLVVDPGLIWSTFLGGSDDDFAHEVETLPTGHIVVAGQSRSLTPPGTTLGFRLGWDGFAARFAPASSLGPAGQLQWMTYIGGMQDEVVLGLELENGGFDIECVGWTDSIFPSGGFPVTPSAWQPAPAGLREGFVSRIDLATGATLVWSSFVGGTGDDHVATIHSHGNGVLTVVGVTDSPGLPTTPGAFQPALAGNNDLFVLRLDTAQAQPSQQLVWMTYFGGSGDDGSAPPTASSYHLSNIMVTSYGFTGPSSGEILVAGATGSQDLPTRNAFQSSPGQGFDGFVCRLDPSQSGSQQLSWGTYLAAGLDEGVGAIHEFGHYLMVCGSTESTQFPVTTANAFQGSHASGGAALPDGFLVVLDPTQTGPAQLAYGTFFGGSGSDHIASMTVDGSGLATIVGTTDSAAGSVPFPTTGGAFQTTPVGPGTYAFVSQLRFELGQTSNPPCQVRYSTLIGGAGGQNGLDLAPARDGGAVVVGATQSPLFPTTPGSAQTLYGGGYCGWISLLDLLPTGATRIGSPTPGSAGRPVIAVESQPKVGNSCFAITCDNAPPGAAGVMGVSLNLLLPAVSVCGVQLYIDLDPSVLLLALPMSAGADGRAVFDLPIPNNPGLASFAAAAQFAWIEPAGGRSASAALGIVIQP